MKGYVYLIENKINGKHYVGKTYFTVEKRWKEHIKEAKRHPERPLYAAILKYGESNFVIKELEFGENVEEREIYWINFYNSYRIGYNATLGGDGTTYFEYSDEEVIEKYNECLSITQVANFFNCDPSTISKRLKNNGIEIKVGGDTHNEKRHWKAVQVHQYSLDGVYLRSFESCSSAARWIIENTATTAKVKHISNNISKASKGVENRKKAYNYIWKGDL